MHKLFNNAFNITLLLIVANATMYADIKQNEQEGVETIVIIRHAEKPKEGLGQLSVIGLKRSLLLPKFFKKNFQQPQYIKISKLPIRQFTITVWLLDCLLISKLPIRQFTNKGVDSEFGSFSKLPIRQFTRFVL